MTSLKSVRAAAAEMVESALKSRVAALKLTPAFIELKAGLLDFEENGNGGDLRISEEGYLISSLQINLDRSLCTDEDGNGDSELAEAVLKECSDVLFFMQSDYSQGYFDWTAELSHGDCIVFNESPERNCYAIFSRDLGLEVDTKELIDEEHGYLLIETAMRASGYFPAVVSTDSCGFAFYRSTGMGMLTDEWVAERLATKLASRDSD